MDLWALSAAASGADPASQAPLLMEYPDQPRPHHSGECEFRDGQKDQEGFKKAQDKHAKTELVLSSVTPWEIISKEKGVTTGGYMCKHCQGFWKQDRAATRLAQIIGRHRSRKISLQLIMDEPPEALYNQWIKDRIEYYKRVEWQHPEMSNWIWVLRSHAFVSSIPMTVALWDNSSGSPS